MKICTKPEIWAENSENFTKIGDVSDQGTQKQMLVVWACDLRNCVYVSWIFNEHKIGNPAKDFRHMNVPMVGPGIKSMGARMHLQHAKG